MQRTDTASTRLISVVIPTYNRVELLRQALNSVFAQSHQNLEVIVVSDGPSETNKQMTSSLGDSRLLYHELPKRSGVSAARNFGVSVAKAEWIAFLDDDDEWVPVKLEKQLEAAERSKQPLPMVISRFFYLEGRQQSVWPVQLPQPRDNIGDYLFTRKSFFSGASAALTSTFFCHKGLFRNCKFDETLLYHQDYQWLLEVQSTPGFDLVYLDEPLTYWHADLNRDRLSHKGGWEITVKWGRSIQHLLSNRAYAGFICSVAAGRAAGDLKALPTLCRELLASNGAMSRDWLVLLALFLIPSRVRKAIRILAGKHGLK